MGASIIPDESFPSFYASTFHAQASVPSHLAIEFRLMTPQQEAQHATPSTVCRVYMSPATAKNLHSALGGLLAQWEANMGTIEAPNGPGWIPPMKR